MVTLGCGLNRLFWVLIARNVVPSPNTIAKVVLCAGLLSPLVAMMVPNFRWLFRVALLAAVLIGAAVWVIGEAVDIEAAKPNESLDVLLGYAINFWTVILGGSLFMASAAVRATWFYFRRRQQVALG
jgi:hypothetical protein